MRIVAIWCGALLVSTLLAQSASAAEWDAKRVEKVAADLKAGKAVTETGTLAKSDAQILTVVVNESLTYLIDYKAKVCFASRNATEPFTFVPCPVLRRGYPVLAPLLGIDESMGQRPMMGGHGPGVMPGPGGMPRPQGPPPRPQQ